MYPPLRAISPVLSCPPTTSRIRTFLMTRSAGQWPSACRIRSASCSGVGGFRGRDTAGSGATRTARYQPRRSQYTILRPCKLLCLSLLILKEQGNVQPMLPGHDVHNLALFTDLYELTMLQAYVEVGMQEAS